MPLRITFITPPPDRSGGQRVVATYADRLSRRGHQVQVVAFGQSTPPFRERVRSLFRDWWSTASKSNSSHYSDLKIDYRVLSEFRPVVDADVPDADIVIATWWETAEWLMKLSDKKGTRVHFIQHHEVFDFLPAERSRATYRLPLRKIVVAQWLADVMRDEYGDPTAQVVPNAVDLALFHAAGKGKNQVPTVGFLYAMDHSKGTDVSINAIRLARKSIPELRVIAFGYGPSYPHLALPEGAEYHMNPPQDSIRRVYAQCDAWLFGSRTEGFGLPILEAMACRTPVIGTPAGAAPELLAGGGGYLVKPDDPNDMAEAIVRLCGLSNDNWQRMSDAAHSTASRYTWDEATDLFEGALQTAVEQGCAPIG